MRDSHQQLLYYEGTAIDITRRKQEEENLKQQVQQLRIEIDQAKCDREVAEIIETDYFRQLQAEAEQYRIWGESRDL